MFDPLYVIPHQVGGLPVFGLGWALLIWLVGGVAWIVAAVRREGWSSEASGRAVVAGVGAAVIVIFLPSVELVGPDRQTPIGLPLRGYGLMVTAGVVAGVGLAVRQARQMGVDPDEVFGLSLYCFVAGIAGGRGFYVIQYWSEYSQGSWLQTARQVLRFWEGGLVVYGALLGAIPAGWIYLRKKKLPVGAMADLVVPSLLVGLALGRIGCFLHGCCFAGMCEHPGVCVQFPSESPPYQHQWARGQLHGVTLGPAPSGGKLVVRAVDEQGPAASTGLKPGDEIRAINGQPVVRMTPPWVPRMGLDERLTLETSDGRVVNLSVVETPQRSRPVKPVQLFSAVHAGTLAFLLWAWYPFRRRDGELFALLLSLYPVGRVLEEVIRDDEPGRWGTALTISQWVSLLLLVAAGALWVWLLRQPQQRAWPVQPGATDAAAKV